MVRRRYFQAFHIDSGDPFCLRDISELGRATRRHQLCLGFARNPKYDLVGGEFDGPFRTAIFAVEGGPSFANPDLHPETASQVSDRFSEVLVCVSELNTFFADIPVSVHQPLKQGKPLRNRTPQVTMRNVLVVEKVECFQVVSQLRIVCYPILTAASLWIELNCLCLIVAGNLDEHLVVHSTNSTRRGEPVTEPRAQHIRID